MCVSCNAFHQSIDYRAQRESSTIDKFSPGKNALSNGSSSNALSGSKLSVDWPGVARSEFIAISLLLVLLSNTGTGFRFSGLHDLESLSIIVDCCWGIAAFRGAVDGTICGTEKLVCEMSSIGTGSKAEVGTPALISQRQVSAMEPSSCWGRFNCCCCGIEEEDWLSVALEVEELSTETLECKGPFMLILLSGMKRACGELSSNMVGETEAAVILLLLESEFAVFTNFAWVFFARGGNVDTLGAKVFFWTAAATRLLFGALVLVMDRHRSRS